MNENKQTQQDQMEEGVDFIDIPGTGKQPEVDMDDDFICILRKDAVTPAHGKAKISDRKE
ncbi:hypothetical protein MBH78_02650 [Oceanimonas sp. NS1]|nr:hypothetical protein [Oceanimonas sp. NS1]